MPGWGNFCRSERKTMGIINGFLHGFISSKNKWQDHTLFLLGIVAKTEVK